jgi:hypothetical protein
VIFALPFSFYLHDQKNPFQAFVHTFDKIQNVYTLNGVDVKALNESFANINLITYFLIILIIVLNIRCQIFDDCSQIKKNGMPN